MKRRSFLKTTAAATAATPFVVGGLKGRASSSLKMLAQLPTESDRVLVVIQLFGGNDGLNTLVPANDDEYYRIRPAVSVPKALAWNGLGDVFLHPALTEGINNGIAGMLEVGNLAIVQGVGYDNPNLSHFRSTDIWLSGINDSDPNIRLDTGWIGRYLEQRYPDFPASLPDDPLAIQFGGFSLLLRGSDGKKMGIELSDPTIQQGVNAQLDELDGASAGTPYLNEYTFIADIAQRSNKYADRVKGAYESGASQLSPLDGYGANPFGEQLRAVAAMVAGGLNTKVYVVSIGGFDTHVNQQRNDDGMTLTGMHPLLLHRISQAVAQFQYDLIRLGQADRVVGLTLSEFGRRPRENGSFGTDHGAASVQFVFGTNVNSAVFGEAPDLVNLNNNGDLRAQIDYRTVYTEILTDWFGLPLEDAREVLQNDDLIPLDVLQAPSSVRERDRRAGGVTLLGAAPNPFAGSTRIEFSVARPDHVIVEISSMEGGRIVRLFDGHLETGSHQVRFEGDIPSGNYLCTVRTSTGTDSRILTCLR